jgi:hypothetical protein
MQIPTEHDRANLRGEIFDEWAKEHFFGKSLKKKKKMFVENTETWYEAVMIMPPIPFQYYVHAYMSYLLGNQSKGDCDAASCFIGLIEIKAKYAREDLVAVWTRVLETLEHIRKNPDWFDWTEKIYGNLEERIQPLLAFA